MMSKSNRRKFWVVVAREFNVRVRKKSFLVTTILVPILFIAIAGFAMWMAMHSVAKEKVAILDKTGIYASLFEDTDDYSFYESKKSLEEFKAEGKDNDEGATLVMTIDQNLLENQKAIKIYGYREVPSAIISLIQKKLSNYLTDKKFEATGIPNLKETVKASTVSLDIDSYKWDKGGNTQRSSSAITGFIGLVLAFIGFNFIATYGSLVMSGVLEEKKNRIMEVMVSSVRPLDLMGGKIVGVALVGIFQLIIWILLVAILAVILSFFAFGAVYDISTLANISQGDLTQGAMMSVDASNFNDIKEVISVVAGINIPHLVLMFLLYFVGGYLLYAALYAAVAASMSSDEDANQFMIPIMIILMFALYSGFGSMNNPNSEMAMWCSLIPFTSPVAMLVRIPSGVPIWQELISVGLLYLFVFLLLWMSAKIYRVGILMYGKKPSLKEIGRWLFYK